MTRDSATGTTAIRLLRLDDSDALRRFLERDPDRTLFFRSNLARAGIEYTGQVFSAEYVGVIHDGEVRAVVAHCWNGMMLLHAGAEIVALSRQARECSGRTVTGFIGPWDQVAQARSALGLQAHAANMESRDILFGLDLVNLRVPRLIASGADAGVHVRPAADRDMSVLTDYRVAYHRETLGTPMSPGLHERAREELLPLLESDAFVLEEAGRVRACSFFNARVTDTVQIGGVFTAPEWRGRGYGRAVVAGSLMSARALGVERSVLFTSRDNLPARRAYTALGYHAIDEYGLVLLSG